MIAVMSGLFVARPNYRSNRAGSYCQDFHSYSSLGLVVTAYLLFMTIYDADCR